MTRRRVLLLGSVAVVMALAGAAWAVWPRPTAITRENAERLQPGMTLAEIEAILGGPPRDETSGPTTYDLTIGLGGSITWHCANPHDWKADTIVVRVCFNGQGRACMVGRAGNERVQESVVEKLRRWLGL